MSPRHLSKLIPLILAWSLPEALLGHLLHGTARFAEGQHVHITDSFWKPLLDRNRAVTIPHNLRMCREVGVVANFERVAGLRDGDYHGLPNWDEFLYKAIEAAGYGLQQRPDLALEKELDDLIAVLAKAQDADGYLRTVIQMSERGRGPANLKRWSNLGDNLELYCAGHLFEAGVAHFQATGKRSLLEVALKNAQLIDRLFGPGKRADVCGHQEIEPALVRLYEATDDERWWKLAKFFVDTRGTDAGGRRKRGEFSQDHAPLFEQTEAVGQAPRATYFYSGAADVGRLTGDPRYHTALRRLWENVVTRKLYLNGGIGSRHDNEGFGPAYELPSRTAYTEVCAAVSFPMWATRMFRVEPDARYFDVIERTLYNNLAAGVSLSGDRYFYACPLGSDGNYRFNLGWLPGDGRHLPHAEASATRKEWFPCACCPPTLARYLPQVPGFTYATRGNELFVNLFIAGEAEIEAAGTTWKLKQEGNYAWDGRVKLVLNTENRGAKLKTVFVRIPGWTGNEPVPGDLYRFANHAPDAPMLAVNGRPVELRTVVTNGFARLVRAWRSGDLIELDLPMPVRHVIAHPDVKDCAGKGALQRGPIVYCFEGAENGGRVLDLAMSADAVFAPRRRDDLLGGTTVLEGELIRASERIRATAIPYHLWSNRGAGEMTVWLNTVPAQTLRQLYPPGDFVPLFSADALKSWRQCGPGRFLVTNGVATGEGGMGLWWYAGRQFTNFVLRGEFVQEQELADSGVYLRFPDPGQDPWVAVHKGHEMEIGDPAPKDPTWRTGSIYPFAASTEANTKPVGQWNTFEITCEAQDYTVRVNDEIVTRWTDPKARTSHGFIGLQNYNDNKTVRHRDLRIQELP